MSTNRPFLIMHRRGVFKPGAITDNQCSQCGQTEYHYKLIMAFDNTVVFDSNSFIFDSLELTKQIDQLNPIGSCEQMHLCVCTLIAEFFADRNIPILTYKCSIVHADSVDPQKRWFEHVWLSGDLSHNQKVLALTPHLV